MTNQILSIPVNKDVLIKKRVVIYARVSTQKIMQETSYELQAKELVKLAKTDPHNNLICIFADKESGSTMNRPAFQRMIELVHERSVDLVLTKSISRFGRNLVDTISVIRDFKNYGCEVYFEDQAFSSFDNDCDLRLNLLASVAEEERDQVSENTIWALTRKMAKGESVTTRMYGYRINKDEFTIVPKEAQIVRQIFDWYIQGITYKTMIERLSQMGIRGPADTDLWHRSTLEGMLVNEKYVGDMFFRKTFRGKYMKDVDFNNEGVYRYFKKDHHKGIVPRDVFDLAQQYRTKRTTYHHANMASTPNRYSKYFFSTDTGKHFTYTIEKPKDGKYQIPTIISKKNGTRVAFKMNELMPGFVKAFAAVVDNQQTMKRVIEESFSLLTLQTARRLDSLYQDADDLPVNALIERHEEIAKTLIQLSRLSKAESFIKSITKKVKTTVDCDINLLREIFPSCIINGFDINLIISVDQQVYSSVPSSATLISESTHEITHKYHKQKTRFLIYLA